MSYTEEQIKAELLNYKLPWVSRVWKKGGVPALRYSILPLFLTALTFGIIYNESTQPIDWMWWVVKGIALLFIFGFGILALLGHVAELITVNKLRKKLGLSHQDFKNLVEKYKITGM